jgi:hypothetical protein
MIAADNKKILDILCDIAGVSDKKGVTKICVSIDVDGPPVVSIERIIENNCYNDEDYILSDKG